MCLGQGRDDTFLVQKGKPVYPGILVSGDFSEKPVKEGKLYKDLGNCSHAFL